MSNYSFINDSRNDSRIAAKVITPTKDRVYNKSFYNDDKISLFLAGTIEMGNSVDWQSEFIKTVNHLDINIYNPRRADYDPTWEQSLANLDFVYQVNWELSAIQNCHMVIFYFDPESKSPISLMELGYCYDHNNVVVCCPDGFYRKGNVELFCLKNKIKIVQTFDQLVNYVITSSYIFSTSGF